jgi:uncharacterized FAD-dependent dehydrogenase
VLIEDGEPHPRRDAGLGEQLRADHVVLALGHSARDTFTMLHGAACSWRPSRSRSAFASSIRRR